MDTDRESEVPGVEREASSENGDNPREVRVAMHLARKAIEEDSGQEYELAHWEMNAVHENAVLLKCVSMDERNTKWVLVGFKGVQPTSLSASGTESSIRDMSNMSGNAISDVRNFLVENDTLQPLAGKKPFWKR